MCTLVEMKEMPFKTGCRSSAVGATSKETVDKRYTWKILMERRPGTQVRSTVYRELVQEGEENPAANGEGRGQAVRGQRRRGQGLPNGAPAMRGVGTARGDLGGAGNRVLTSF